MPGLNPRKNMVFASFHSKQNKGDSYPLLAPNPQVIGSGGDDLVNQRLGKRIAKSFLPQNSLALLPGKRGCHHRIKATLSNTGDTGLATITANATRLTPAKPRHATARTGSEQIICCIIHLNF